MKEVSDGEHHLFVYAEADGEDSAGDSRQYAAYANGYSADKSIEHRFHFVPSKRRTCAAMYAPERAGAAFGFSDRTYRFMVSRNKDNAVAAKIVLQKTTASIISVRASG
jgi:hypothetical protein